MPDPVIHDEFSYLLASDTFAHGRLANPGVAEPEFFESPHVLVSPVYASKYQPGQGLVLAIGQKFLGDPYWGVVLSTAVMIFLFCWAAEAWLPPQWTLIAGCLSWILFFIRHYWFTSYWGGSLAACGGALIVGGLGRVLRGEPARFSLAAGAVILYATRPYEGGALCVATLAIQTVHFWRLSGTEKGRMFRGVLLPSALLIVAAAFVAAGYNSKVTGHPTVLPYMLHGQQYDSVPALWVLPAYGEKHYFNENNRAVWAWALETYHRVRNMSGPRVLLFQAFSMFIGGVWTQFLGFGFLLFGLAWARVRNGKTPLVLLLAAWAAALFPEIWMEGHYSAPFTVVQLILIVATGRAVWYRIAAMRSPGLVLIPALIVIFAPLGIDYAGAFRPQITPRGRVKRLLESIEGNHLVFVQYPKGWNFVHEWVYNGADLSRTRVLFAHFRSDSRNEVLIKEYENRSLWLARLGPKPDEVTLERYDQHPAAVVNSAAQVFQPQ